MMPGEFRCLDGVPSLTKEVGRRLREHGEMVRPAWEALAEVRATSAEVLQTLWERMLVWGARPEDEGPLKDVLGATAVRGLHRDDPAMVAAAEALIVAAAERVSDDGLCAHIKYVGAVQSRRVRPEDPDSWPRPLTDA